MAPHNHICLFRKLKRLGSKADPPEYEAYQAPSVGVRIGV